MRVYQFCVPAGHCDDMTQQTLKEEGDDSMTVWGAAPSKDDMEAALRLCGVDPSWGAIDETDYEFPKIGFRNGVDFVVTLSGFLEWSPKSAGGYPHLEAMRLTSERPDETEHGD